MHVVVIGAGAVGGYFGAKLAQAGESVTFLVRERRFEELQARGLRVHSALGDVELKPQLATDAKRIDDPDVVLLSVKNYHLEGAIPALQDLVKRGARVLPLLNGVNHLESLRAACGLGSVLGGACFIEATLNAQGDVIHGNQLQDIIFGRLTDAEDVPGAPDDAWLEELRGVLAGAGIHVKKSADVNVDMWQKYIFLTALSGITAVTRQPIGVAVADTATRSFLTGIIREMESIARARQVDLPDGTAESIVQRLDQLPKSMTSSLHKDLEKGLPLELDSLQGAAVAIAESEGLSAHHLRAVYAILHPYQEGGLAPYRL